MFDYLDSYVGFTVTQFENWADAIIAAGLPEDGDVWAELAESVGIDIDYLTDSDLRMVERMVEERAR